MEAPEVRLRRLAMRAMRRGTKEMDIILGGFADRQLSSLDDDMLSLFDALLSENDQDLYLWVTGQSEAPEAYSGLVAMVAEDAHRAHG